MTYQPDLHAFDLAAGDWLFADLDDGPAAFLWFGCPCGCGEPGGIPITTEEPAGKGWHWNGDKEKPTLTPSIQRVGGCAWHGFLTDGVFKSC